MLIYLVLICSAFFCVVAENSQELSMLASSLTFLAGKQTATKVPISGITQLKLMRENNEGTHLFTKYQLGNYQISLIVQDILREPADAIVNAANSGCLGGGGIDGVISNAGGEKETQLSEHTTLYDLRVALPEISGTRNRCPLGGARITRGGWLQYDYTDSKIGIHKERLNFNYVIHAVGPSCSGGITEEQKKTLANTYVHVLERVHVFNKNPKGGSAQYSEFEKIIISDLGDDYRIKSLSFPTISTGIFGCSTNETADFVVDAVCALLEKNPESDIKQIKFVFWDPTNQNKAKADYALYKKAFNEHLKSKSA